MYLSKNSITPEPSFQHFIINVFFWLKNFGCVPWLAISKYWIRITVYGLPRLKWWNLSFYIIWLFTKLEEARATALWAVIENLIRKIIIVGHTYSRKTKLLFMYLFLSISLLHTKNRTYITKCVAFCQVVCHSA